MQRKENAVVSISHGFHIRNFLQTKFIHALTNEFNVVLAVNDANKKYLEVFVESLNVSVKVVGVTIQHSRWENKFVFLRKNIFINPKRANTKNILNELYGRELGKWRKLFSILNQVIGRYETLRKSWRMFEGIFITGTEFDALLDEFKPSKVITANYGTEPFEIRLLRAARRKQIKTIAIVPSWDNLTSKGVMGIQPDSLLVWNEIMEQEAIELHSFTKDRIHVTGPLQFDNFFDKKFILDKNEFRSKFRIEEARPIIAFGTITPKYFKYNVDVLNIIKDGILSGRLIRNPKVLVRIHPQVVKDPIYGDNLDQYLALAEGNDIFAFSIPEVEEWATMQVPKETDYRELISLLTHAEICISSASTLIFDSFACNSSFIGIGFDGYDSGVPPHKSVRRMFEFEHYKNVYAIGGFSIAESQEQLYQQINDYLLNPAMHADERARTLEQQIKFTDGKNYQRAMEAIKRL